MRTDISVIIPSYNSYRTIVQTLDGVLIQDHGEAIKEIIVVDSSDGDKTRQLLDEYKSGKVKIIYINSIVMPAMARNIGSKEAKGSILAFIDADAFPAKDWAGKIYEAYEKGYMVGGGAILIPDFQQHALIPLAQLFLQFNEYMAVGNDRVKKFVPSCNLFCDKELFVKAGGFPEIRAAEDVLFGLNVSKLAEVWLVPGLMVYHIFREGLKEFLGNQMLLGMYIIAYKRVAEKGVFYYEGVWPLLFLPVFVLIKFIRMTCRVFGSGFKNSILYILSLPLVLLGIVAWSSGFAKGVFKNDAVA